MPFTVGQLIKDHQDLKTVSFQDSAKIALQLLVKHDFSQLPVIDDENKPLGIITHDSILRALNHFEIPIGKLKVSHAVIKVKEYNRDDDLFDLLDDLRDTYAVLIVNSERTLIGIVTNYDTTEYFRRRAEDMMYVEDIETTLKDYIRVAFTDKAGNLDLPTLDTAIAEVTDSASDLRKKFQSALHHYLSLQYSSSSSVNKDLATQVFIKHFASASTKKSFDSLTLSEYIQLVLYKSKWDYFYSVFSLERGAIFNLLDSVRKTRNSLAHFRGEISPEQQERLHFCAQWLSQHPVEQLLKTDITTSALDSESTIKGDEPAPVEEEIGETEGRYAQLALWLQNQPVSTSNIQLTFSEIKEIIDGPLPPSAQRHRAWWANDSVSHPQSQQWLEVGWRVSNIYLAEERVIFSRIKEREKSYISFFSTLLGILEAKKSAFGSKLPSPDGTSWITFQSLPEGRLRVASLNFSFARHGRFRVELYIDTGNQEKNKRIFGALEARKSEIRAELEGLPGTLEWERMDTKRASRIALYHEGAITDTEDKLAKLQTWAVDAMIQFQRVMGKHLSEVV